MTKPDWDRQFAETEGERQSRQRAKRQRLILEGKCWQCAKSVQDCQCTNVLHNLTYAKKP